jgi:hypothetical protein
MTDIRVTRQALEVVAEVVSAPDTRVTRQALEVVAPVVSSPETRVTRVALEVLTSFPAAGGGARRLVFTINYLG